MRFAIQDDETVAVTLDAGEVLVDPHTETARIDIMFSIDAARFVLGLPAAQRDSALRSIALALMGAVAGRSEPTEPTATRDPE